MLYSTGSRNHELIKGHTTLSDFPMLVDPDCEIVISDADIAAVCDRHNSIDAGGFVRVVRTTTLSGAGILAVSVPEAERFMNYYHADGSVAEMRGNVARLFTHILDREELCPITNSESVIVGTRGGARTITRLGELWTVDMRPTHLVSPREADDEGWDTAVDVPDLAGQRIALSVEIFGPHTAAVLEEESELKTAAFVGLTDSAAPVAYDPTPKADINLELVAPLGEETDSDTRSSAGIVRVRALERGVGESLSYGAGCCTVAVALHAWTDPGAPKDYRLLVPSGEIGVHVGADLLDEGGNVLLTRLTTIAGRVIAVRGASGPSPPALLPDVAPTSHPRKETDHHYEPAIHTLRRQHHPAGRLGVLRPVL